ncbi:MAG: radical SAM protein [Bacteroidales bacterium]|nr:radical SAM protein [Bacteroidales bacterium]
MYDRYNRKINYLRVSVTDKCNLRCYYCMPEEGVKLLHYKDILSYEEIAGVVRYGVEQGIDKVRLTGGEPLVKREITRLVAMLASIPGVKDLSMTTNALLLPDYAEDLVKAGLQRVNVSLDTLDPEKYSQITRGGNLNRALEGIEAARKAGLNPIKLNAVMHQYFDEEDRGALQNFAASYGYPLRFIREMDLEKGTFSKVEGGSGGDCRRCNRLRLTPNGKLKPCLFSDLAYDVRELGIEEAYRLALETKPRSGSSNTSCTFYRMGG